MWILRLRNGLHLLVFLQTRARFLSVARSKLRLCSANHRPGYWSNLPCDWPSTAYAYSEQDTENWPWSHHTSLLFAAPGVCFSSHTYAVSWIGAHTRGNGQPHVVHDWLDRLWNIVYPKKYAHGFVVLCFVVVMQSFIMNSHEVFIHIHQGCFAGTGAIVRLPQCQWSKPDGYGKISQCIATTKHSKAKTVCIFLGIYCKSGCWNEKPKHL